MSTPADGGVPAPARQRRAPVPLIATLAALLAYGVAQIAWGEAVPATGGLGFYDGRRYGEIAMDLPGQVFRDGLDAYRLQRVLPSALVYGWLRLTGQTRDARHVRDTFQAYNLALLLLTAVVWAATARALALETRWEWLGHALLFLNFANLKMPFYNAVLTDTTALLLGALLVWFYVRSHGPALFATLAVSAFTWPPLLLGAVLYVLPRPVDPVPDRPLVTRGSAALGVLAALGLAAVLAGHREIFAERPLPWLTGAILLAYTFATQATLLHVDAPALRRQLKGGRLLHVVALVMAVGVIVRLLAPEAKGFTLDRYLREIVFYTSLQPALFLVAHAVYFGLAVCIALVCWPGLCRATRRLGTGLTVYVAAQVAQAIDPESRHLIPFLPVLVLLAVLAAREVGWPKWAVWATAAAGLAGSKWWWPINQGEFGHFLEPPLQYYYMNHGGAMSPASYRLQGAIVALATLATLVLARRLSRRAPSPLRGVHDGVGGRD